MGDIKLAVKKLKKLSGAWFGPEDLPTMIADYETEVRTINSIRNQINTIYRKIQEARQLDFEPTYLIINRVDYQFLKAYFQFHERNHYIVDSTKVNTIFGLRIIVSDKKQLTVGWEP